MKKRVYKFLILLSALMVLSASFIASTNKDDDPPFIGQETVNNTINI
ncbi:hypothetical protein NBE98_05875 [Clostridium swellfunianum]|nr:hypothetical protein [Clostridium swellfunianum]MCM0647899.1 hypothetical protein [Clostridium swellfunianum]